MPVIFLPTSRQHTLFRRDSSAANLTLGSVPTCSAEFHTPATRIFEDRAYTLTRKIVVRVVVLERGEPRLVMHGSGDAL